MHSLPGLVLLLFATLSAASSPGQYVNPALTLPPTPQLPPATKTGYVPTNNVSIWYAQFGPPLNSTLAAGISPIIFIHGGYGNSDYFGHQVSALLSFGAQATIITIDSRKQGRSTGIDQPISYDIMRDDTLGVMDYFGIPKATIVGWSDGGIIGYDIAINYPKRLDRLFAFAGQYSYENTNASVGDAATFTAYLERARQEYMMLSPTPDDFDELNESLMETFAVLPNYTQTDFAKIPTLEQDCLGSPLIWVVDAADEEVVNRDVPTTLHNWIDGSGQLILPSASHFAFLQDPLTFNVALERFLQYDINCTTQVRPGWTADLPLGSYPGYQSPWNY